MKQAHRLFFALLLFCLPVAARAEFPSGALGIAVPSEHGITVDGSRLGDAEYDLSKPRGGALPLFGASSGLSGRALSQSTKLDDAGSRFSALTVMIEKTVADHRRNEDYPFLSPSVSAGMSLASMDVEVLGADADDAAWILQLSAGVAIRMSPGVTLDLRYRYLKPFEDTLWLEGVPESIGIEPHNLLLGVRVGF
ncbi:MAG: porin family protein [Chlorobaculum sp.]|nr:porin family protein [Chlorobaculum sp.]